MLHIFGVFCIFLLNAASDRTYVLGPVWRPPEGSGSSSCRTSPTRDLRPASISRQARREELGAVKFWLLLTTCLVTRGASFINAQRTAPCMCVGSWLMLMLMVPRGLCDFCDSPYPEVDFIAFFQRNERRYLQCFPASVSYLAWRPASYSETDVCKVSTMVL